MSATRAEIRALLNRLGSASHEIASKVALSDRAVRYLRQGERECPDSTFLLLSLRAWLDEAWPYLKSGEVVPDRVFWKLETILKRLSSVPS